MTLNLMLAPRRVAGRSDLLERRLGRYDPCFQRTVRALAARHSRIADLAVSFPALLFALAVPRRGLNPAPALARVVDGAGLAEAAAAAELPMWTRKLPPEAFARPIARLPDGELFRRQIANHLPRSPKLASTWLQAVADVAEWAHEPAAVWIARELVREPGRVKLRRLRLVSLWAWFSGQPATSGHALIEKRWTPDMRIGAALEAADDWRTTIDLHVNIGAEPIDDMWLEGGRVAGYDFLPLTSVSAITEEANTMRNCLRTYGTSLSHNRSRLWSVRRNGERVATLNVGCRFRDPLPNIIELEAAGNTPVSPELWWVARHWLTCMTCRRLRSYDLTGTARRSIARPGYRYGGHTGWQNAVSRNGCRSVRPASRLVNYEPWQLMQAQASA